MCLFNQLPVLDEAVRSLPDGVDVVSGLGESVKLQWSGDVDLNDGKLDEMHSAYSTRLQFIESIGIVRRQQADIYEDLTVLESGIIEDLTFLNGDIECFQCLYTVFT